MKRLIVALCLIVALLGGIYGALSLTRPTQKPTAAQTVQEPLSIPEIHRLVNEERAKVGAKPLTIDQRLVQGATIKATELGEGNYLESNRHRNKDNKSGFTYSGELAPECQKPGGGENLLWDTESDEEGVKWWMGSNAHREAMLDPTITIVGYAISGRFVVQHMC